jgi:hypothetical protein
VTGAQLLTYTKRRLAENGLTVPAERELELYDYITEGRDEVKRRLAMAAPVAVKITLTLEVDVADDRVYRFPIAAKDPLRVIEVRDKQYRVPLDPAATLDCDTGDYEWLSARELRLAEGVDVGQGVEIVYVAQEGAIAAGTAEADIGAPVPTHRAIGKLAAVLALTADEESDATTAMGLYEREMTQLEQMYGDFDANGGEALRAALMESAGDLFGDTLY